MFDGGIEMVTRKGSFIVTVAGSGGDEIGFDIFCLNIVIEIGSLRDFEIGFVVGVVVGAAGTGVEVQMTVTIRPLRKGGSPHYIVK